MDVTPVLTDPLAVVIDDEDHEELRHVAIGMGGYSRILVVCYTWRNDTLRIISARKATKKERKFYEG